MEIVKFIKETQTLKEFFQIYCENKHQYQEKQTIILNYKNQDIKIELYLCKECLEKISYSFDKLLSCPHEIKPRCRACPKPCYEKKQWKETAKVMRYSGLKMGLLSVNKKIKNIFKKI